MDAKRCADGRDYKPGTEKVVSFRFADHAFRLEKGDFLRVDVSSGCSQFAPHGNVKGLQAAVRTPKVARNSVRADAPPSPSSRYLDGGRAGCLRQPRENGEPPRGGYAIISP